MSDSGWMNPCLTEMPSGEFFCSHANRMVVWNSITSQKSAPKIASPINPSLPTKPKWKMRPEHRSAWVFPIPAKGYYSTALSRIFLLSSLTVLFAIFYGRHLVQHFYFFAMLRQYQYQTRCQSLILRRDFPIAVPMASPTPTPIAIPAPSLSLLDFPFFLCNWI